jgi:SAM-dependent methyltransferase
MDYRVKGTSLGMKQSFTELLQCAACHQALTLTDIQEQRESEIWAGVLSCHCKKIPIVRGIPRFTDSEQYADNFGFEWQRFAKTQLDSHTNLAQTRNTFVQKTGWSLNDLKPTDIVLDVGCGAGRFLAIAAPSGATIIGVDLSNAVDVAYENAKQFPNVHIIQADVFELPFSPQTFTKIYSIGVLHHTPSTEQAFKQLPPLLKDEGELAIWVYRQIPFAPKTLTHFVRLFTKKMSHDQLISFSQTLDKFWYPIVKSIRFGNLYPLRFLLLVSVFPDPEWRILNNFDSYSPKYNHQHTPRQIQQWFKDVGLTEVRSLGVPTAVQGKKA